MKKLIFILTLLSGTSLQMKAQLSFQKTYAVNGGGNGYIVELTSDGGYCFVGSTGVFGSSDVFLIKTDINGDTLWTRYYGGPGDDIGWFLQQTSDNGYIITGFATNIGAGGEDVYLIRTDSIGNPLWIETIGGPSHDRGNCVQQTTDGGFIIAGYTSSFGAGNTDIFLVKTDGNGDISWTKTFGGINPDLATTIEQTTDGGFIITGMTTNFGSGSGDVFLIKTDMNGVPQWQKAYGDFDYEYGYSVHQTADEGYVFAGYTHSFGAGDDDWFLVKTDSIGDLMWSKTYGESGVDRARNLSLTSDGGYILAGWTYSFNINFTDVYLLKADANGDVQWTNSMGEVESDAARNVKQTADGGYIITGGTDSFSSTSYDLYVIKTDSGGNTPGCYEFFLPFLVSSPATQVINFTSVENTTTAAENIQIPISSSGLDITVLCTNVGMEEMTANNQLIVYPNPSAGEITISFKENITRGTIEIVNAIGAIVYTEKASNILEKKINLGNIDSGVYFVKIFDGKNILYRKIIVEK